MTIKIEAHERTIGDIFSDAYEFEIPPYQRPYAWESAGGFFVPNGSTRLPVRTVQIFAFCPSVAAKSNDKTAA
jgi:hypothetical protein